MTNVFIFLKLDSRRFSKIVEAKSVLKRLITELSRKTLQTVSIISQQEATDLTEGLLAEDIPVRLNRLIFACDQYWRVNILTGRSSQARNHLRGTRPLREIESFSGGFANSPIHV